MLSGIIDLKLKSTVYGSLHDDLTKFVPSMV